MSTPFTRAERDAVLGRAAALERQLYPPEDGPEPPSGPPRVKLMDAYYQVLHEYGDRLPRIAMSRCPHTQQVLKRSFDPFGLDGHWWHKSRIVSIEEPPAPATFRVLLGALDLRGRVPAEAGMEVIPGPEVPFVVPKLMRLDGMQAVISRRVTERGDVAHVIAYFADEPTRMQDLHQHWLRQDLWYPNDSGGTSWLTKNDVWDFDLGPWLDRGVLWWIAPDDDDLRLRSGREGCPFLELAGEHAPQSLSGGARVLLDPPNGKPVDPYAEW